MTIIKRRGMELSDNNKKTKVTIVVFLILAVVFFLASGFLGYLYWNKNKSYDSLASEKANIESSIDEKISEKITELETKVTSLESEKSTLEAEKSYRDDRIESYKTGMAKISSYKEALKHYYSVVETHRGYTGWTDQEYAIFRSKAEATGDKDFVDVVDYAWNETSVDVITRVLRFHQALVTGFERGIK